jgi:hypothetical protein
MKIEKNKIVFGSVLAIVVIFIISYSILIMSGDEEENQNLKQTTLPELESEQKKYDSKLDAINDLEEVRETNAPSIYDEKLLDSLGYYDPDLRNKEKERIVDSIYSSGRINYVENSYRNPIPATIVEKENSKPDSVRPKEEEKISAKEMGLEHQLFFSSNGVNTINQTATNTDEVIYVEVDGKQKVKANYRLRMRLTKDAMVNGVLIPKNTPVYGFVSFQPNRVMIEIENIKHHLVNLKAYDLQDGSEGIYAVNSFRAEASRQIIDDVIQDINIPSVPQLGGIKSLFRKSNRNIKVTISNNYQLLLKP